MAYLEEKKGRKPVLLFSAGMDSFMYKQLFHFQNEQCLFVDMGTEENKLELYYINKFYPGVQIVELKDLVQFELENKIIPYRNHFLALIAANYGNIIHFAFTAGDTTKDKDFVFTSQVDNITNYFSQDENKVHIKGPFHTYALIKTFTKKEVFQKCENLIGTSTLLDNLLYKTVSCYNTSTKNQPCGCCRSCLRKFVAIRAAGYAFPRDYFYLEPDEHYLKLHYMESKEKGRSEEELEDIKKVLKL